MVRSTVRRASFYPQILLALALAGGLYVVLTLPPRAARLAAGGADPRVVVGAYHIHTNRSDGSGSPDEIAAAASRAGLQFVILTDHSDATRPFDPPQYRHGVLCLEAAEVSTSGGHVVALGLARPSPYPLAGEPRDVVDDILRLGGWAVVAHPDSPKTELRWRNGNVPFQGLEWLSLDSEWRDETASHLAGTFARYLLRGPEAIVSLASRPVQTLRRWDMVGRTRPIVGLAATDAHARLSWRLSKQAKDRTLAALPSYAQVFRAVAQAALLDRPFSGDAVADSALLLGALRAGRAYSVVTAIAAPGRLTFVGKQDEALRQMGEFLGPVGSTASLHADVNDNTARLSLLHNGAEIASGRGRVDFAGPITPGPYRVEAYRPGVALPWIVSNPIYGGVPPAPSVDRSPPSEPVRLITLPTASGWAIEHSPTSTGAVAQEGDAARFAFALGPGPASDQFAALVTALDPALAQQGFDRVQFTVRAERPLRFSVQVRLPGGGPDGRRWRHSVYADETPRRVILRLQDFEPAEAATSQRPIVSHVRAVLVVIDTLNAVPSTRGAIWLSSVALGVGNPDR